jgi:small subunit ribosomal protein S4
MVRHGHLVVNGKKVSIPSFLIRKGDQVTISAAGQKQVQFQAAIESSKSKEMPNWLDVDRDQFKSVVKDLPTREDITMPIEERMVVELYSK